MKFKWLQTLGVSATLALPCAASAAASYTLNIPATSDIWDAGRAAPIAPSGDPGALPVLVPQSLLGITSVQFGPVTGTDSSFDGVFSIGPDGLPGQSTSINSYAGISGFMCDQGFPLVGVFLDNSVPANPAPATLNFTSGGLGRNFLTLSPALGQVFFVGDGQTDGAQTQVFNVPAGATRLFLGLPDAPNFVGDPGHYGDNAGSLTATVLLVPEPGSGVLLLCGALLMGARGRVR